MTYNQETIIKQKRRNERDYEIHKDMKTAIIGFTCLRR